MKDMPVFDTEYGVASLVLKEVPYRQEAYIWIRSALEPEELLRECIAFCRMVGAERIYARGHEVAERHPLRCAVLEMGGSVEPEDALTANLWPVTEDTIGKWRQFLNEKLKTVDNAATLEKRDEKDILEKGELDTRKVCLTCSKCTAMMRKIHATGCPIRDREVYTPMYKELFSE